MRCSGPSAPQRLSCSPLHSWLGSNSAEGARGCSLISPRTTAGAGVPWRTVALTRRSAATSLSGQRRGGRDLEADDAGSPGVHTDVVHIGMHHHGIDGLYEPVRWPERLPDFRLLDPSGTQGSGLPIAEAQHVVAPAARYDSSQRGNELEAILIVEDVKQPAVQHGVELLPEVRQFQRIPNHNPRAETAILCLALRDADRPRNGIDAGGIQAASGCHECVCTGSASDIQYASCQQIALSQFQESRLGPPNIPWRSSGIVHGIEAVNLLRGC